MLNLICRILISGAYDSPIVHTNAVIWLLSCSLHPLSLRYGLPMPMDAMTIIPETGAEMIVDGSPHVVVLKTNNIKTSLQIINIIKIQW